MGAASEARGSEARRRPTVLVTVPHYLPGFKAGGPVRTVSAMVEQLGGTFRFRVVTSDRDVGDAMPFEEARTTAWVERGKCRVRYLSPNERNLASLRGIVVDLDPDLIYLNSFYHTFFTFRVLLLRRLGLIPDAPVLLAPRGHLSPGARSVKPVRKTVYIAAVKLLGLTDGVVFHASEEMEREEIKEVFPRAEIRVAPNLFPELEDGWSGEGEPGSGEDSPVGRPRKEPGELRVVFLSRISPKKNLAGALQALDGVAGRVDFSIVGPVGEEAYWSRCRALVEELPDNVTVEYRGGVPHDRVPGILREHHVFFLPTRSENFGHVIREALQVGRPVLLSDRTPWEGLEEAGAGWACPLQETSCYRRRLDEAVRMREERFAELCAGARQYVESMASGQDALRRNRELLWGMIRDAPEAFGT